MTFTSEKQMPRSIYGLAAGRGISFLGDEVALLAMAFRAQRELGRFGVAAILIAGALPLLLLVPFAGLLVDRVRARPLLVTVLAFQAALCVALAWASPAMIVPLIALLACGTAIVSPAWQALVPTLVERSQLPAAMGLMTSFAAVAQVAGPFVGGFLVATWGFHVPMLVDAASFLVLAAVPLVLRVDRVPSGAATGGISMRESLAGVRVIAANRMLRTLVFLAVLLVLTAGVINVVEIYFVTDALHAGPRGYGLLGVAMGAGMLVTGVLSGRLAKRFDRPERLFVTGCVAVCVGIGCFGLTTQLWQGFILVFIAGIGEALLNVNAMVLISSRTHDEVRGRVFSAVQGTVSAAQIGALGAGGLLLLAFSARSIILVSAVAALATLAITIGPVLRAGAPQAASTEGADGNFEVAAAGATA